MLKVSMKPHPDELISGLWLFETRQVPFATSRAINLMTSAIKKAEQSGLERYFTIRVRWLKYKGGMPVDWSDKKQWPNVHSTLHVKDMVASLAASGGGMKRGMSGMMAVPLSNALTRGSESTRKILNPSTRTLRPPKWPSGLKRRSPVSNRRKKKGSGRYAKAVFQIKTAGSLYVVRRRSRTELEFLYSRKRTVYVPGKWPLERNIRIFGRQKYREYFDKAFRDAIK